MKTLKLKLTGIAPLMMHSERAANPRDKGTIELKKIATQKKKSEETLEQLAEMEWRLGIYEQAGVPCLPADNLLACVKEGARKRKIGKQVEAGVFTEQKYFTLDYDGPKTVDGLWKDGRFFDYRSVGVNQRRVMRARPRFDEWSAVVAMVFDEELISESDLLDVCGIAGLQVGLCEKRPQFGRFQVEAV